MSSVEQIIRKELFRQAEEGRDLFVGDYDSDGWVVDGAIDVISLSLKVEEAIDKANEETNQLRRAIERVSRHYKDQARRLTPYGREVLDRITKDMDYLAKPKRRDHRG